MGRTENVIGNNSRWDYQSLFREYLLLLAGKGKLGLEKLSNFPNVIELPDSWHESLNKIREESKDGFERWLLVGYRDDVRNLYISNNSLKGSENRITGSSKNEVINKAKKNFGLVNTIGNIHSHPKVILDFSDQEKIYFPAINFGNKLKAYFSPADFHCLLAESNLCFTGLVEGDYNLFAFKTASTAYGVEHKFFNHESFKNYWYERYTDSTKINMEIAKKHNLVLYQGRRNKDLKRISLK